MPLASSLPGWKRPARWPVQIRLVGANTSWLKGADVLVAEPDPDLAKRLKAD